MKSFFIVVVLMLRNGGAQTRIGGAPRAKESVSEYGTLIEPIASIVIEPPKSERQSHMNRELLFQSGISEYSACILYKVCYD